MSHPSQAKIVDAVKDGHLVGEAAYSAIKMFKSRPLAKTQAEADKLTDLIYPKEADRDMEEKMDDGSEELDKELPDNEPLE